MSVEESVEELVVHHPLKAVFIFKKIKKVGLMLELTITMEKSFLDKPKYAQLPDVNQEIVRDTKKQQLTTISTVCLSANNHRL